MSNRGDVSNGAVYFVSFLLAVVVVGAMLAVFWAPRCAQGHYETRHIPARTTTVKAVVSHQAARDVQVWICDIWEKR